MILENNKKEFQLKKILNYTLPVFLSIIFLFVAFRNSDLNKVFEYVSHPSIIWIIIFILSNVFSHFLRAVRWKVILHSVKKDVLIKNAFGALMIGYGVNFVISRLGEFTRAALIGKWEGISRSSMFGTVMVERVIDVIFLGLALVLSVYISKDLFINFPWLKSTLYISFFLMLIGIFFLYLTIRFKEKFYNVIIKIVSRFSVKMADKAAHIFEMLTEGFASLRGIKNYLITIILSAAIMFVYALNSYIGFFTLGMQNMGIPVSFKLAWVLMSISAIGAVIPTPGGTGSYHTLAKSVLVFFGFSLNISLAYAFLTHIISFFLIIFLALISFFLLNKQHLNLLKVVKPGPGDL
ncbi:MAG: lysylphosphatidylglycerol synthase transmembrane domain-containing protein [Ignavibacteriaceae bacterium]|nr:lysylphosphatidylglycerol synthase transmembrane domain-containing protein [Ignavibacteriaceae bacterium]